MRNKIILIILLQLSFSVVSQTISLEFPYFAGQTYEFKIFQGDKHITIKEDTIPKGGKVQLVLPKKYQGYKGMAQWYLTKSKTGGGLDLIINNEDFSVSCLDSIPTNEGILYSGSKEATFNKDSYKEQQDLFEKHDALFAAVRAYSKNDTLYPIFDKEYKNLVKKYTIYYKNLVATPLYAARFRQIVNLTMGIGNQITNDEKAKANNINDFVVTDLNFAALYTSNHWGGVINSWVQLHNAVIKDNAHLLRDITTILRRLPTDTIYTDFVVNLTKEISRAGKDYLLDDLTAEIKNTNHLLNYDGVLNIYKKNLSGQAPNLKIVTFNGKKETNYTATTILKTTKLSSKFTLLIFYRSDCGPCKETMTGLTFNYKKMIAKGLRIITISADTDETVFKDSSMLLPWNDKYCDFEGTKGINFKNYAVIGTPTMYVLNSKGIIISKMATLDNVMDFVRKL